MKKEKTEKKKKSFIFSWIFFIEIVLSFSHFKSGQGMGILNNSIALKKDLKRISAVMLSHGHYDHVGGLPQVLKQTGPITVHAHPDLFVRRFWRNSSG